MPAATLITALPKFISPSEHAELVSSTPEDFASIPPVLRHSQENVKVTLEPPLEGFSSEDGATGTLYVVERYVFFSEHVL
jgi:chloride channel, nucleotide-sensitive, 1A